MLGEGLRLIRVFHDIQQKELADKLGVAQSYISEIESGKKQPTIPILEKYATFFDIPVSSILFFSEAIEENKFSEKVRVSVSKKVLKILDFIAQKAGRGDHAEEEKDQ